MLLPINSRPLLRSANGSMNRISCIPAWSTTLLKNMDSMATCVVGLPTLTRPDTEIFTRMSKRAMTCRRSLLSGHVERPEPDVSLRPASVRPKRVSSDDADPTRTAQVARPKAPKRESRPKKKQRSKGRDVPRFPSGRR